MLARHSNTAQQNPIIEQEIKDVFYNLVANYVLNQDNVTMQSIDQHLLAGVRDTILKIIRDSSDLVNGIRLPSRSVVTRENCPGIYQALLEELLRVKASSHVGNDYINDIIMRVTRLDSFQALNPKQFILEATGLATTASSNQYDEHGITADLIRQTFYNEMVMQALLAKERGWLTVDNFESQDAVVYLTLPALTILEAIHQSTQCSGIRLLDNKIVTAENCPQRENFQALVKILLETKQKIMTMSPEQMLAIKHKVSTENELPSDLQPLQTHALMVCVSGIKDMAIQITQRKVFHEMVGVVMATCLDTWAPVAQTLRR